MEIQSQILQRFFQSPESKRIESELEAERVAELRKTETALAKLKKERDAGLAEPTKRLLEARAGVDRLLSEEFPQRQLAVVAADAALGRARAVNRREIIALEQRLAALNAQQATNRAT
jgi:hypothetical protein